jgi:hypothetical protein
MGMSIHHRLAEVLIAHCRPGQVLSGTEIKRLYRMHGTGNEMLFPAHHAHHPDQPSLCRACREYPLLEKVYVKGHIRPHYRVIVTPQSLPEAELSAHELLSKALEPWQGHILHLDQIRSLLEEIQQKTGTFRVGLPHNVHQHTSEGRCTQCIQGIPLLERTGREQYKVLVQTGEPGVKPPVLTWDEVCQLVRDAKQADALRESLQSWLLHHNYSHTQADQLLNALEGDRSLELSKQDRAIFKRLLTLEQPGYQLLRLLWRNNDRELWSPCEQNYHQLLKLPIMEMAFENVLPWRAQQSNSGILWKQFLLYFLDWHLKGWVGDSESWLERREKLEEADEKAIQKSLEGWRKKAQLKTVKGLKRAFEVISAVPGFESEGNYNGNLLISGLLAVIFPRDCFTLMPTTLGALETLNTHGDLKLSVDNFDAATLGLEEIVNIQLAIQQESARRNQAWGAEWLTPRRLDQIMLTLGHLAEPAIDVALKRKHVPTQWDKIKPESTILEIQVLLESMLNDVTVAENRLVQSGVRHWTQQPFELTQLVPLVRTDAAAIAAVTAK